MRVGRTVDNYGASGRDGLSIIMAKFSVNKNFRPKVFWPKSFRSNKVLVETNFGPKYFQSIFFWSKSFSAEKIFGQGRSLLFEHERSLLFEQERSLLFEQGRSLLFEQGRSFLPTKRDLSYSNGTNLSFEQERYFLFKRERSVQTDVRLIRFPGVRFIRAPGGTVY